MKSLLRFVAEDCLPELTAQVAAANAWLADRPNIKPGTNGLDYPATRSICMARFSWRGHEMETAVMPYHFYLLLRLTDAFSAMEGTEQAAVRAVFAETGLEPILGLATTRRVERHDHLEVWGD